MAIVKIRVNNSDLTVGADFSFLKANVAAAAGTITVNSINKFAINKILLIGEFGEETSEIIKTHASTAPTGNTVTLASNTVYAHNAGTKVYIIDYDQYELSHATTATGTKTALTTTLGSGLVAIDAESRFTLYNDTQFSTGFYFVRKKDSIGATFSAYSDAIPATGLTTNTVGHAIEYALKRNGLNGFDDDVDHQFMLTEANSCLKYIQGKQLRWDEHHLLNAVLGQTSRGTNTLLLSSLSTEIYDNDSNKSITAVRVGDGSNLIYKDPEEWEGDIIGDVKTTQVTTQASAADTTLEIDNSYDFDDSGTVNVYISGTKYSITYTGVTRSATAGVLTGVPASGTGSITVTIPVDTNVWQDEDEGNPKYFTVRNQKIEIYPLPDATYDNKNVYLDYWTIATEVDSDGDTLDTDRFDMVKYWLTWAVRSQKKHDGRRDLNDSDFVMFRECLNDAIRNKGRGMRYKHAPKLNTIDN